MIFTSNDYPDIFEKKVMQVSSGRAWASTDLVCVTVAYRDTVLCYMHLTPRNLTPVNIFIVYKYINCQIKW